MVYNRYLNNRPLGSTKFSLHRLLDEPCIQLAASLVDANERPLKVPELRPQKSKIFYDFKKKLKNHDTGPRLRKVLHLKKLRFLKFVFRQ
jgi:hypothetical protein